MDKEHQALMNANYTDKKAGPQSRLLKQSSDSEQGYFCDVNWLKEQIDAKREDLIILDVTRGVGNYKLDAIRTKEDYEKAHIPTAIHFSTDELGEFKVYFKPATELRDAFLKVGVMKDTLLVVYSIYARDIMYIASRVAIAAYYLGVDNVKVLDGGLQAWERAGFEFESGENLGQSASDFGLDVPKREGIFLTTPEDVVHELEVNPEVVLASVRTWNEFLGKNAGHSWNEGSGEVYKAVYAGDDKLSNVNGEMADPADYLNDWASWGITKESDNVFYCGTSWRSSTAALVALHLGFKHVRMYDGSWYKWYLAHKENPEKFPIQRGNPKEPETYEVYPPQSN